jgi:hypothetical protein
MRPSFIRLAIGSACNDQAVRIEVSGMPELKRLWFHLRTEIQVPFVWGSTFGRFVGALSWTYWVSENRNAEIDGR